MTAATAASHGRSTRAREPPLSPSAARGLERGLCFLPRVRVTRTEVIHSKGTILAGAGDAEEIDGLEDEANVVRVVISIPWGEDFVIKVREGAEGAWRLHVQGLRPNYDAGGYERTQEWERYLAPFEGASCCSSPVTAGSGSWWG